MKEKEKMLLGELYNANDDELINDRIKAKNICFEYNNLKPVNTIQREEVIKKLFVKTGNKGL